MNFDNKLGGPRGPMKTEGLKLPEFSGAFRGYKVEWDKATGMEKFARSKVGKFLRIDRYLVDRHRMVLTICLMNEFRERRPHEGMVCKARLLRDTCEAKLMELYGDKVEGLKDIEAEDRDNIMVAVHQELLEVSVGSDAKGVTQKLDAAISAFRDSKEIIIGAKMKVDLYAVAGDYFKDNLDEKTYEALVNASTPKREDNERLFKEFCMDPDNGVDEVEEKVLRRWFRGHLVIGLDTLAEDKLVEVLVRMRGQ